MSVRKTGMIMQLSVEIIDMALFLMANLVNLLIIGIMLSRPLGLRRLERILGVD